MATSGRPVIGITCHLEAVHFDVWHTSAALVPLTYVRAVTRVGGIPLLIPPVGEAVDEVLEIVDGLIFSGGPDVAPSLYGAAPGGETSGERLARDVAEVVLMSAALEHDVPLLGICRGAELLNVVRGGTLVEDLPTANANVSHCGERGDYAIHAVRIEAGSIVWTRMGEKADVASHHHQAPGRLGKSLWAVAWAEDGAVEAIEDLAAKFTVGVMWHAEEGSDSSLFAALVEAAAA
jgi:gamma-glutamyl-gamma-aminobutyrate hydrolase PuuD